MNATNNDRQTTTASTTEGTPPSASEQRAQLMRDLLEHPSMERKNANALRRGDRLLKVGDTWHDVKHIIVTHIQPTLLGYVMVYGTTAPSRASTADGQGVEALIFRGLAPTVKVVTVDAEAVAR